MNDQTVAEFLFELCSESLLEELAEENDYWRKADTFVNQNRDKTMKDLKPGQRSWLLKIKEDLIEEAGK